MSIQISFIQLVSFIAWMTTCARLKRRSLYSDSGVNAPFQMVIDSDAINEEKFVGVGNALCASSQP